MFTEKSIAHQKGARGFASMNETKQREIARKGGETVSQNRAHMAEIGRKGGEASHAARLVKLNQEQAEQQPASNVVPRSIAPDRVGERALRSTGREQEQKKAS